MEEKYIDRDVRNAIKTAEKKAYAEGYAIGYAIGYAEGRAEARAKIIKALLNKDIDIEVVSRITGLSIEKLRDL